MKAKSLQDLAAIRQQVNAAALAAAAAEEARREAEPEQRQAAGRRERPADTPVPEREAAERAARG